MLRLRTRLDVNGVHILSQAWHTQCWPHAPMVPEVASLVLRLLVSLVQHTAQSVVCCSVRELDTALFRAWRCLLWWFTVQEVVCVVVVVGEDGVACRQPKGTA